MKRSRAHTTARDFPRTARLNHLVQEIVADEIERLDDDRLGLFTVTGVDVDPDLRHATVWYTALAAGDDVNGEPGEAAGEASDGAGEALTAALAGHRPRLQAAIARQARLKRTPELVFRPDTVIRQAERVEAILRELRDDRGT
ncbi:MAG TPA: ribosome-binding factor A [Acidimicrobiales bacterium]|jgi:ribosome-binding factor A|nr:ribosome-binding factor A [Acidimicrobiales bacterium]